MKTIKSFTEQSRINEAVIRAVVRKCGGWQSFKEMATDVANHGANGGFSGFIYYSDTVPFATRNKKLIIQMAKDMADDLGENVYQMIANFNCLGLQDWEVAEALYQRTSPERTNVLNALAWFALEEVARSYDDLNNA